MCLLQEEKCFLELREQTTNLQAVIQLFLFEPSLRDLVNSSMEAGACWASNITGVCYQPGPFLCSLVVWPLSLWKDLQRQNNIHHVLVPLTPASPCAA